MKKIVPLIVVVLSLCFVWSCEKESTTPSVAVVAKVNPTDNYLATVGTKVLFASVTVDHEAATTSGWLIDNKGDLRKINSDRTVALRDEIVTDKTINALSDNSELVRTLDKEELVSFHKLAKEVAIARTIKTNDEKKTTSAFVSYRSNQTTAAGHDCYDTAGSTSYVPPTTYQQTLLVATGHLNQVASETAIVVNEYLQAFEKELK